MTTSLIASWWGYAEADPTIVGILVVVVAAFAIAFLLMKLTRGRDGGAPDAGKGKRRR